MARDFRVRVIHHRPRKGHHIKGFKARNRRPGRTFRVTFRVRPEVKRAKNTHGGTRASKQHGRHGHRRGYHLRRKRHLTHPVHRRSGYHLAHKRHLTHPVHRRKGLKHPHKGSHAPRKKGVRRARKPR